MSLRRTTLARTTRLQRNAPLPRTRARARRVRTQTPARRPSTGPTPQQRLLVAARAGWCCELCGKHLHDGHDWVRPHSFHHRKPRGMGGTDRTDVHAAYQLLLLCGTGTTGCHGWVERNRRAAYDEGLLVPQAVDSRRIPVLIHTGTRVYLTTEGTYSDHPEEQA